MKKFFLATIVVLIVGCLVIVHFQIEELNKRVWNLKQDLDALQDLTTTGGGGQSAIQSLTSQINTAIAANPDIFDEKDAHRQALFRLYANNAINAKQAELGRELTYKEKHDILLQGLVMGAAGERGWFGGQDEMYYFEAVLNNEDNTFTMPFEEIKDDRVIKELSDFANAFYAGRKVTDDILDGLISQILMGTLQLDSIDVIPPAHMQELNRQGYDLAIRTESEIIRVIP